MSALLKATLRVANDEALNMPPRAVKIAPRVAPTITFRPARKKHGRWRVLCIFSIFFVGVGAAFWYASNVLEVLKLPVLEIEAALPDPETAASYAETITPPPADVVAPVPVVPALPDMPAQAVTAPADPMAGIVLPASSLQVPYPVAPEANKPAPVAVIPAVAVIEDKIKDAAAVNNPPADAPQVAVQSAPAIGHLLDEAQAKLDDGDDSGALLLYDRILARDRKNRAGLAGKAFTQQRLGQYEAAAQTDRRLLSFYPKDEAARADLLTALGAWGAPAAMSELQRIVESNPGFAPAQAALAQALMRHNDALQALPHAWRAVQIEPENILYQLNLAIAYDRLGHSGEAIDIYRQVLKTYNAMDTRPSALPVSPSAIQQRVNYLERLMESVEKPAANGE